MEAIRNNTVYARELESGHLPGLYYLVSWKIYLEEENIWEPVLAVQYLQKLPNKFHYKNSDKLTTTYFPVNTAISMVKLIVKLSTKQKRGQLAKSATKCIKK